MPYYTRDGYKLYYEDVGDEQNQSIVFIHGYLGSSRSHWGPQLDDNNLNSKYRLIAPDLRGFAKSSVGKFVEKNKTQTILEDIHYLISDVLKLNNPVLVGYSVGATICIQYYMQYNINIGGIILVGPRPFISSTTRSWNFLAKEKRSEEKKKSASSFTWSIVKRGQKVGTYISALYQRKRNKDYLEQISQIKTPMLMIYGTKDTVTPQLIFNILKDCLPSHTEYYVYEGDHGIAHERTKEFNELVLDFLEKNKHS